MAVHIRTCVGIEFVKRVDVQPATYLRVAAACAVVVEAGDGVELLARELEGVLVGGGARLPRPRRRGCSSPQAGGALTFSQQLEKVSKKSRRCAYFAEFRLRSAKTM